MNGKTIKIGTGRAGTAAEEIKEDLDNWKPWKGPDKDCPNTIDLLQPVNDECQTWSISKPLKQDQYKFLTWARQITAPTPLPAINDLFRLAKSPRMDVSPLMPPLANSRGNMVWVNKYFFQSEPEGNRPEDIGDDALGFFSLIVSYVKTNAKGRNTAHSPKSFSPIMPRTDFLTIYNDINCGINGDLYELVKKLLCYKNGEGEGVEFDSDWCHGSPKAPSPNTDIDNKLTFEIDGTNPHTGKDEKVTFTLEDWISGLNDKGNKLTAANQADKTTGAKDLMANYDRWVDGQIGGLKDMKEHVYNNNKDEVPLFEFRNLGASAYDNFKRDVENAEDTIISSILMEGHGVDLDLNRWRGIY